MEEKDIKCTFRYVHNSVQAYKFMLKLLAKSRKIYTKCNKTHTLLLNVTEIIVFTASTFSL